MPTVILRSLMARIAALVVAVGIVAFLVLIAGHDGVDRFLQAVGWCILALMLVWILWWAPMVQLSSQHVYIRNGWRHYTVPWEEITGCGSRWNLVLHTRSGRDIPVVVAQRRGGIAIAWQQRAVLRQREMFGKAGSNGRAVTAALEHRGVREEFLEPGQGTFRAHLDADSAADLMEAYLDRRAVWIQTERRANRRTQRIEQHRERSRATHTDAAQSSMPAPADDVQPTTQHISVRFNPIPIIMLSWAGIFIGIATLL